MRRADFSNGGICIVFCNGIVRSNDTYCMQSVGKAKRFGCRNLVCYTGRVDVVTHDLRRRHYNDECICNDICSYYVLVFGNDKRVRQQRCSAEFARRGNARPHDVIIPTVCLVFVTLLVASGLFDWVRVHLGWCNRHNACFGQFRQVCGRKTTNKAKQKSTMSEIVLFKLPNFVIVKPL